MFPKISVFIFFVVFAFPQTLMAQTSGTSAPEVAQFEPVDTTDLVNLATGDFSYAIPAMVIPGAPGGAYPLSLNYHAGILHGQEASWVGLGWNLSPGAVTRLLRGYPDDWNGGLIHRTDSYKTVYGYSIGFGYKGFSAGVHFNNHQGFSGVYFGGNVSKNVGATLDVGKNGVGLSLSGMLGSSFGGNVGYHFKGGFSVGANFRTAEGLSLGANFSEGSGIGASLSFLGPKNEGTSLKTEGLGFSLTGTFRAISGPTTVQTGGGTTFTSSQAIDIPFGTFNLSLSQNKSKFRKKENSTAFGYLHLPQVRDRHQPPGEMDEGELGQIDELDPLISVGIGVAPHFIALDFYTQDYQEGINRNILREKYEQQASFYTDYQIAQYDLFNVAAQGVSGTAKPVLESRGWIRPSDSLMALNVDEPGEDAVWRFHPNRSLFWRLKNDSNPIWDQYHQLFRGADLSWDFYTKGWLGTELGETQNMVFTEDPGFLEDTPYYQTQGTDGSPFFAQKAHIRNRSKQVHYEMDSSGTFIRRIIVTKPDGIRYIFGVIRKNGSQATYGAAPRIKKELSHGILTKDLNMTSPEHYSRTEKRTSYAYAWNLAAVESPGYVDRAPEGYGPEDFGSFVAFEYAKITGDYGFETPWSNGPEHPHFMLTGVKEEEGQFSFERKSGTKEVMVPWRGWTKTHVVQFTLDDLATHRIDAQPREIKDTLEFQYKDDFFFPMDLGLTAALSGFGVPEEQILIFPTGLNLRMGEVGRTVTFNTPCCLPESRTMTYKGSLKTGWDVFIADQPLPTDPPGETSLSITIADTANTVIDNRLAVLKSIELYERDPYLNQVTISDAPVPLYDLTPAHLAALDGVITQTRFEYDPGYPLGKGMPNSEAQGTEHGGRLTLKGVTFFSGQGAQGNPGFGFTYYNDGDVSYGQYYRRDPWGFYSSLSAINHSMPDPTVRTDDATGEPFPTQALYSLKTITTPVGTTIGVSYEADRYSFVQDRFAVDFQNVSDDSIAFWNVDANWTFGLMDTLSQFGDLEDNDLFVVFRDYYDQDPGNQVQCHLLDPTHRDDKAVLFATLVPQSGPTQVYHFNIDITCPATAIPQSPGLITFLRWLKALPNFPSVTLELKSLPTLEESEFLKNEDIAPLFLWSCGGLSMSCPRPFDNFVNGFVDFLNQPGLPTMDVTGYWQEQVMVGVHLNFYDAKKWFVLPIVHGPTRLVDSPAFREMLQWIASEYHFLEDTWPPRSADIITMTYRPIPIDAQGNPKGHRLGGGLRVAQVTLSESFGPESHSMTYHYTDPDTGIQGNPETGLESGSILADPATTVAGARDEDHRIVAEEQYPFLNHNGGQVLYGAVTVKTHGTGLETGSTTYRFITAKDQRIHQPFAGMNTPYVARGIEAVYDAQPDKHFEIQPGTAYQWKPNPGAELWEVARFQKKATYHLDRDVRKLILNNSNLLGKPHSETSYDQYGRKIQEKIYGYQANYAPVPTPEWEGNPVVKQFSLDEGAQIQGKAPEAFPGARASQGVWVEKNQGFYMGLMVEGAPEEVHELDELNFQTKILLTDEVFNVFRKSKVTTKLYDHRGDPDPDLEPYQAMISTERPLVYDYYTGAPVLTQQKQRDKTASGSNLSFHYNLNIPAHVLFSADGVPSMTSRNMLSQPGLSLKAQGTVDLHNHLDQLANDNGIFTQLKTQNAAILDAGVQHWSYFFDGSDGTWRNDAQFSFVHDRDGHKEGWRTFDFKRETPTNLLVLKQDEPVPGQGYWETAGQNTRYDALGNVIESRNRLNVFSAAHTIHGNQRVGALFDHAQIGQTYYQGFEDPLDPSLITGLESNPTYLDGHGVTKDQYLGNYARVYAGSHAFNAPYPISFNPDNGYDGVVTDNRNRTWLSFYYQPNGTNQPRLTTSQDLLPVDPVIPLVAAPVPPPRPSRMM